MAVLNKTTWILVSIVLALCQIALGQNSSDSSDESESYDDYELIFAHVVSIFLEFFFQ